jgi:broad specificity phosphatase PhoE
VIRDKQRQRKARKVCEMVSLVATTAIVIRHAERSAPTLAEPDPHLTHAGKARAQILVRLLGEAGIKAIYTSHFVRTKETAQPLAERLGLVPTQIDEALSIKNQILSLHTGKTVLVVGHSDSATELINHLTGINLPAISDQEFDNMFIVTVFNFSAASVTKLKY